MSVRSPSTQYYPSTVQPMYAIHSVDHSPLIPCLLLTDWLAAVSTVSTNSTAVSTDSTTASRDQLLFRLLSNGSAQQFPSFWTALTDCTVRSPGLPWLLGKFIDTVTLINNSGSWKRWSITTVTTDLLTKSWLIRRCSTSFGISYNFRWRMKHSSPRKRIIMPVFQL